MHSVEQPGSIHVLITGIYPSLPACRETQTLAKTGSPHNALPSLADPSPNRKSRGQDEP
jgi:hypothetical protein